MLKQTLVFYNQKTIVLMHKKRRKEKQSDGDPLLAQSHLFLLLFRY